MPARSFSIRPRAQRLPAACWWATIRRFRCRRAAIRRRRDPSEVSGTIIVESSGLLDLATNSDSAGNALVTVVGPSSSATSATGSGSLTGTSFTTIALAGTSDSSSGRDDFRRILTSATTTFSVEHSGATDDLNVSAVIAGTGLVVKSGWGTLDLSNDQLLLRRHYIDANGGTVVVAGRRRARLVTGTTTVNAGSTLAFRGGVNYSTGQSIDIAGSGVNGLRCQPQRRDRQPGRGQ